jgi:glutamate racemase
MDTSCLPIGMFDSGVGGLSVLREVRILMTQEDLIYFADQANVPYGSRSLEEVQKFSLEITKFLLSQPVKAIVVACNTASAAALRYLREVFPDVPFIGMEPAVKPATEQTKSGVVGVLATRATFQGELYASVLERFAHGVKILQHTCPGLVSQIEKGSIDDPKTRAILEEALLPMLEQGIDTVVLGCTHYPFVIPVIRSIVGPNVRVIDPAPAVARQVKRVLESKGTIRRSAHDGKVTYYTTGDVVSFERTVSVLLGEKCQASSSTWDNGKLFAPKNSGISNGTGTSGEKEERYACRS